MCISRHVADDVIAYIENGKLGREGLKVGYWHLGSNAATNAEPAADSVVRNAAMKPYALMIGTIEPRKNHALALDAFERLWEQGSPLNLVIAGRNGWLVDALIERLRNHPLRDKRLFVIEGPPDAELAFLYRNAASLLFVSKGEGFGLPLIEAAAFGTPIICSDIPVFHEISGEHAWYADISDAERLARDIGDWWARYQKGDVPHPQMRRLNWAESTDALIDVVFGNNWYWTFPGPDRKPRSGAKAASRMEQVE